MAETEYSIRVEHVEKSFRVFLDKGQSFKERLLFRKRNRYEIRPVLRDISFQVKRGEAVGLVGHNGCGKSTTLKLLTKILYPDKGTITMKGRVSSLIELGAGFHPDMSGRENIILSGMLLGFSEAFIRSRMDEIIEFAGLGKFIDMPVRTYSSGMYSKLAFSITAVLETDIMLIDEVLSVGDEKFKKKSYEKMKSLISNRERTVVIVSHSLDTIADLCDKVMWMHEGKLIEIGTPEEVLPRYLEFMK